MTDAKTDEDVTAFILTQIVLEEARKKNILLPSPLLHLMIRHGDNLLGEFFDKYLEQALKNFLACKSLADEQFERWLRMGTDLSEENTWSMPGSNPFPNFFDIFGKARDEEKVKMTDKKPGRTGKGRR